jgi:hypothetical protein
MKNSLIYALLVTCIFIAGTAQLAMPQDQKPSPSPSPGAGVCRNEDSGDNCPCNPGRARNAKEQCVPDPCLKQRQAYAAAVAAQLATQKQLNKINSSASESAMNKIKDTDPSAYAAWQKKVKAATKANNDAVNNVNDTTKKLDACIAANNMHPR